MSKEPDISSLIGVFVHLTVLYTTYANQNVKQSPTLCSSYSAIWPGSPNWICLIKAIRSLLIRYIVMVRVTPTQLFWGQSHSAFDRLRSSHCPAWQQWRVTALTGPPHREQL
jgi:hypothetical protein